MNPLCKDILTLNGGSSSIKFAWYRHDGAALVRRVHGQIERIGQSDACLVVDDPSAGPRSRMPAPAHDFTSAAAFLLDWIEARPGFDAVAAVGHRVVHGMHHTQPERITDDLLAELHRFESADPSHLPDELRLIELLRQRCPDLAAVACFDTAFHQHMPRVAQMLPLPRRYEAKGLRRYGFHGLSYAYLCEELARIGGSTTAEGRVVMAHMGNGVSLAAVRDGRSIDTSMGFTPSGGVLMGTRSGDLDPGIAAWLERTEGVTSHQFDLMTHQEGGLLGVSETSADMRDLLERENTDPRAAEAVALFCYQIKKIIGSYAAALGGLDTLVFAGGVGEHAAPVRARICEGLGFLGIELDVSRNAAHAALVSTNESRVAVRVIRTDEELMIARSVSRLLDLGH
ncbi:MAG: acetate/propionate family kinase [Gammaproteobacteria bacterium]|nr:acetate/propionate family kinase [Gammaproteobacteria bacterium]MBU1440714.1 acetate/propionate family kinase [Gammaproteobacteria bacterium]MBU2287242.1 acetate/propionate family kinase [Gammaproteobacteria bacterium]MBU2408666.1 acetate/propionate family kinase [Gammaproteobacteria bacterium]